MSERAIVDSLKARKGLIASISLSGSVRPEFSEAWADMRSWNDRNGFHGIEYRIENGVLVESARDAVAAHAVREGYEWVLQIDADAAPFPPHATAWMLERLFVTHPQLQAIGGYCQLKGPPHFPTIDTGTGTWEEHYPGEGVLPVIRTGAHFIMIKCEVFQRMAPPWFRTRVTPPPLVAMMEVDGFARQRNGGQNPLWNAEWSNLMEEARASNPGRGVGPVGEDSSFCDYLTGQGGRIAVDTNLVVGHVGTKIIMPEDFAKAFREQLTSQRQALGVRG